VVYMKKIFLSIKKLKKNYGKITVLNNVSFDIFHGEIIGLLGVNGAGKTTLSKIISTSIKKTSGDIILEDGSSIYDDIYKFRQRVGFCPQTSNLDKDLTVYENLFYAGRFMGMTDVQIKDKINDLFSRYNLKKYAYSNPNMLSGGYMRRVLISRALMHNPSLVILDEPTVGLDPHIRSALWNNIADLKNRGITVILTTHYLDEAESLSDRICFLDAGKLKIIDTVERIKSTYKKNSLEEIFTMFSTEEF
jgi:ABC-2 type transport system ATP-binding protein